ncbi:hypothetical protein [Spongiactinospora rosea]|uniref:hypothetical protein n=1 Tax=Spongiactinospora rosea TaxID=2248750 RepID=UPI0018F73066|nr:hypothetical protein [Spongiactinospora rosea]
MREDATLITPVHLGLRAGYHLEPAVQPSQFAGGVAQLQSDPRPGLLQVELDPLAMAGEPVLLDQPLVDHSALQQDIRSQPGIDIGA